MSPTSWRPFRRGPLSRADERALVEAIREAERGNRGEVRVHLERRLRGADPLERARELFASLGMADTREGTGVLVYVAIADRKAAVYAGPGIHESGGERFWQEVVDEVARGFGRGEPVEGLRRAIGRTGDLLRKTVPGEDRAGNELPDRVSGA